MGRLLLRKLFLSSTILCVLTFSLVVSVEASSTTWTQTYGGTGQDWATAVITSSNGGYVLAGFTSSFGAGRSDFWLVKTDEYGNMKWNKTYGGLDSEWALSIVETSDGGYTLLGHTDSVDNDESDFWLVKTDEFGNMEWNKKFDGTNEEGKMLMISDNSLIEASDGGYVIAGYTDFSGAGGDDFLLIKTDRFGTVEWSQTYGGAGDDRGYSVVEAHDGGYIIGGETNCSHYFSGTGDFLLVKTDEFGEMEWNQTYKRIEPNYAFVIPAFSLVATSDGGYALAGATGISGESDIWLIKIDVSGDVLWNQTYGGPDINWITSLVETSDGGYAITGNKQSSVNHYFDFWIVKTDAFGNMEWKKTRGGTDDDRAFSIVEADDGRFAITGFTASFGSGGYDFWLVKTDGCIETTNDFVDYEFDFSYGYGEYVVVVSTNSTLGSFDFGVNENQISFSVTGPTGTTGYCRIVVPENIVDGDFPVYLGAEQLVESVDYTKTYNGTHTILEVTYNHSTHTIEVTGTHIIPEYSSWFIPTLLLTATLLIITRKKRLLNQG